MGLKPQEFVGQWAAAIAVHLKVSEVSVLQMPKIDLLKTFEGQVIEQAKAAQH